MEIKYLLINIQTGKRYGLFDTEKLAETYAKELLEMFPFMYRIVPYKSYDKAIKTTEEKLNEIANIGDPMKAVYAIHDALGLILGIIHDMTNKNDNYVKVPSGWANGWTSAPEK